MEFKVGDKVGININNPNFFAEDDPEYHIANIDYAMVVAVGDRDRWPYRVEVHFKNGKIKITHLDELEMIPHKAMEFKKQLGEL